MKNRLLLLFAFFILGISQHSFAAFPVKNTATTENAKISTATNHKNLPFLTRTTDKIYGFSENVEKTLHLRNSILPERRKDNTLGILSLIFGIIGIVGLFTLYFGLPFSIAAWILGAMGRKRNEDYSLAGMILGIIGVALAVLFVILVAVLVVAFLGF